MTASSYAGSGEELTIGRAPDGRRLLVPSRNNWVHIRSRDGEQFAWEATARVDIDDDGRPLIRSVTIEAHEGMAPIDLQRFRWADLTLAALEYNARDEEGRRVASEVGPATKREAERKRAGARSQQWRDLYKRERRPVTDDRLRRLVAIRDRERAAGRYRWTAVAVDELGEVDERRVRQLAAEATRRGIL